MIEKMEEKNDKINEIISNTLPYYEDKDQVQMKEMLTLPYDENEKFSYDISKPLLPEEKKFLNGLSENKEVPLYIKKMDNQLKLMLKLLVLII